jgi:hypothetical protein
VDETFKCRLLTGGIGGDGQVILDPCLAYDVPEG